MSVVDLVQGILFALKVVTKTLKDKGANDLLTKELLITVDSITAIVDGLREGGLITDRQRPQGESS